MVNGKHRDFDVNSQGTVTEVEDETTLDTIPVLAKATIQKRVAGGKITMVEAVTHGSTISSYEATYTDKNGKKHEVAVKPDGTEVKD